MQNQDADASHHPTSLQNLMDDIIEEGQGSEENALDGLRVSASKAIDDYLTQPIPKDPNDPRKKLDTFLFWRGYEKTVDRAQRGLCKLAKRYLTPPPTSTGKFIDILSWQNMATLTIIKITIEC